MSFIDRLVGWCVPPMSAQASSSLLLRKLILLLAVLCMPCFATSSKHDANVKGAGDEQSKPSSSSPSAASSERSHAHKHAPAANADVKKRRKKIQDMVDAIRSSPYGTFDKDSRDACLEIVGVCQSELYAHIYVECAATCTRHLTQPSMIGRASSSDPAAFYDLPSQRLEKTKHSKSARYLDMSDLEGYVVVIAILPLIPGMAAYYYEMMEHVHSVFRPHVEIVVLPVDVQVEGGIHLALRDRPNARVLKEETDIESNEMVNYLLAMQPTSGTAATMTLEDGSTRMVQANLGLDRVTLYLLSADAKFVERMTSPSLSMLQSRISLFEKSMNYDEL